VLIDGSARCWGDNTYGELGNGADGTTAGSGVPVTVSGVTTAIVAVASSYKTCALTGSTIRCWGINGFGDLGDGTLGNSPVPVTVLGVTTGTAVAPSCAALTGGTVQCWGRNSFGQLGNGTTADSWVPVTVTGIATGAVVSSGDDAHSCAVLTDGTVQCWGYNYYGQLGNGTKGNLAHSAVPVTVSGITSAAAVSVGDGHTCALLTGGTVQCWGRNDHCELGNGTMVDSSVPVTVTGVANATAVSTGGLHTCALLTDGTIQCWGYNWNGQLGNGTTGLDVSVPVIVVES
jgi:alpha-tubulin suppressor-like RCC1 family protein